MGIDITADLNYFTHTTDGSSPCADANPDVERLITNYVCTPTPVHMTDLRNEENGVHLDETGFEVRKYLGDIHDPFDDNSETQRRYFEDIATMLKTRLNASDVIVFNHIIRSRGARRADGSDVKHRLPVLYPHVDHNSSSARSKVKEVLGEEKAEKAMQNRFQIINVWRPLGHNPILNTPLSVCDYRTLDVEHDLHPSDVRRSKATVATYVLSRNANDSHKWYYLSAMRSDEMLLIKIFDSQPDVAQFGAHSAFANENASATDVEQISVEARCLVLYDQ